MTRIDKTIVDKTRVDMRGVDKTRVDMTRVDTTRADITKSMLQELTEQPDEKICGDMTRVVPFTSLQ